MTEYECMGCGYSTQMEVLIIGHQSLCPMIEDEKREYREGLLILMYGEDCATQVQEIARSTIR